MIKASLAPILGSVLFLSACNTGYTAQEFTLAGTKLIAVQSTLTDYYQTLNAFSGQAYVASQIYRGQKIDIDTLTRRTQVYNEKSIEVRITALKAVGRYAELLAKYSAGTSAKDLGTSASALATASGNLQQAASGAADASAYVAPAGSLAATFTSWAADTALHEKFRAETDKATPEVVRILAALRADATTVLAPAKLIAEVRSADDMIADYNGRSGSLSFSDKVIVLEPILKSIAAKDAAKNLDLTGAIDAATKAVTALQARIDGSGSLADILGALDELDGRLSAVKAAITQIKKV